MPKHSHISHLFEEDIQDIKANLNQMIQLTFGQMQAIGKYMRLELEFEEKEIREIEKQLNQFELTIDQKCNEVLALRHPTASDLRFIIAITKIVSDVEQIGDSLKSTAKYLYKALAKQQEHTAVQEIKSYYGEILRHAERAFQAFEMNDTDLAFEVITSHAELKMQYKSTVRSLTSFMIEDPNSIGCVLNLLWVLQEFVQMSYRSKSIGAHVIYSVHGNDVRHMSFNKIAGLLNKPLEDEIQQKSDFDTTASLLAIDEESMQNKK